jgi:alkanesulfonate monooxygenase SsuD/methylene tetrahydromethanopterin reductase-like flavin-dependent oxidoreductase (luciferase family)
MPAVQFGYCVPIFAQPGLALFRTPSYAALDTATTMRLARTAETLGYDALWVADHLMLGKDQAILEGWTVLAALAGATARARLGLIHQANPFRTPSLAAKMAATLDQISGGRFIYFLDCGNRREEYIAYGLPWDDDEEARIARMVEGLELTLALWTADRPIDFVGHHYQLRGAVCTPPPVQQPHPPIWLGNAHPAMLRACARYAQGWNTTPVSLAQLHTRLAALAAACDEAGRPNGEIEKSLEVQVLIGADHAAIRDQLRHIATLDPATTPRDPDLASYIVAETDMPPASLRDTTLIGTPAEVHDQLQAYIAAGVTHFMLWFLDAPSDTGMRLFAERILPSYARD